MRVLLDENFPLQLYRRLVEAGYEVEHVIVLGRRGLPDREIKARLVSEADLVFLTHDTEFEDLPPGTKGKTIISRVPQHLPIQQRVDIWFQALETFLAKTPSGDLFDLFPSGQVVGWETKT